MANEQGKLFLIIYVDTLYIFSSGLHKGAITLPSTTYAFRYKILELANKLKQINFSKKNELNCTTYNTFIENSQEFYKSKCAAAICRPNNEEPRTLFLKHDKQLNSIIQELNKI